MRACAREDVSTASVSDEFWHFALWVNNFQRQYDCKLLSPGVIVMLGTQVLVVPLTLTSVLQAPAKTEANVRIL